MVHNQNGCNIHCRCCCCLVSIRATFVPLANGKEHQILHSQPNFQLYNLCQFQNNFGDGVFMVLYVLYIFVRAATLDACLFRFWLLSSRFFYSPSLCRGSCSIHFFGLLLVHAVVQVDQINIKCRSECKCFCKQFIENSKSLFTWFHCSRFFSLSIHPLFDFERYSNRICSNTCFVPISSSRDMCVWMRVESNWPMHKLN